MDILLLTTSDAVRAVIGIDEHDLDETRFAAIGLDDELTVDLGDWFPQWQALRDDASGDADIVRQQAAMKVYAKYFCARRVLSGAQFGFVKRRSDGEVEYERFSDDKLSELRAEFDHHAAEAKDKVLGIDTVYTPKVESGRYSIFGRAPATRDVVSE